MHGLNDNNEAADGDTPGGPPKNGDVYVRPNISHNQTMVVAGLMKRIIGQIPINLPGIHGKSKDFGT